MSTRQKLYLILPVALILCFMVGCEHRAALVGLEKFQAQAAVEQQNIALILKWWEEANKGNIDKAMEMCASDYQLYMPSNSPTPMSKEENREFIMMMLKAFPDINHEIAEIMAAGDKVIARSVVKFTHTGEYMGIPATGNAVEVSAIYMYRIIDGKIAELREEADFLGFNQQLGFELLPKEGEK